MDDIVNNVSILLPTGAASSGAAVNKTEYVVVDGFTPYVYLFSFCGMFKSAVPTLRTYRKIVYDMECDRYFALGCGCNTAVYVLNCRFEEVDIIIPDDCLKISDISLTASKSGETLIALAKYHSVGIYRTSGRKVDTLRDHNPDISYLSFVSSCGIEAEGILKNSTEHISMTAHGCTEASTALPSCITLKNLFVTDGGGLYGFFSKNYIYNYVVPLFEADCINGTFFLNGI